MSQFELVDGNGVRFQLLPGKTLIGRDAAQCQIVLSYPFISRFQAAIKISSSGTVRVSNLSRHNTTFLNGQPLESGVLNNGDKLSFGIEGKVFLTLNKQLAPTAPLKSKQPKSRFLDQTFETVSLDGSRSLEPIQNPTTILRVDSTSILSIGRARDNDIVLDSPSVSRYHVQLTYVAFDAQPVISDMSSSNGTFVNGNVLRSPTKLQPTDWVKVGDYLLSVHGRDVVKQDLSASRIVAQGVGKSYGDRAVLQDVSLALYPREFIGLMGASGSGKSTLMDALNGMRPATSGNVYINNLDLYSNFDLLRMSIGYVPQRDILHEALSVERTLYYAGKLRLPPGTSRAQIEEIVTEVIHTVGLQEQRRNSFKELSGGQQKRLSLGIELMTKPTFLFLDEPTSPLDPETTENMMMLFRKLAEEGRIVVMVTHKFEKFTAMHNIVLLAKGGRLAFFGPPKEALRYFNCDEPSEIYRRLHEKRPEELSSIFQNSPQFKKYVQSRFEEIQAQAKRFPIISGVDHSLVDRKPGVAQWWTLTRRFLEIKLKDLKNTLILLAQAPIVALILAAITDSTVNDARTIFISAVVSIWLGANNAIREIVSETAVYERERLVNLKIPSYVLSKFAILASIGLIQCLMFVAIMTGFNRFQLNDFWMLTAILYLTLLAGASVALFFSALVSSTEKAMSILPLILIPQLLLSGFLKPIDDLYVNIKEGKPALVADFDRYEREKDFKFDPLNPQALPPDPIQKSEGLEGARFLATLITARWTMDALVHQVSIKDTVARDKLASRMTVQEYKNVLEKKSGKDVEAAYGDRVRLDLMILSLFSLLFLCLTIIALKRKDRL
jgi:ABC-type multidrug transport system ATPase subunit/pSer/pThr/pTyr-binding forkhead associated (FHA) protein